MKEVKTDDKKEQFPKEFSNAFKRWLIREIRGGRLSTGDAIDRLILTVKPLWIL
jgi:hypothetical protein